MTQTPGQMPGQDVHHGLDLHRIQQTRMRRRPQPAGQGVPPVGRRNKDAFPGDTQQLPQQSDLTLEASTSFEQLMAGDPVDCFIIKRQPDIFLHRLAVGSIELESAVCIFACVGLLAAAEVDKGIINALSRSLARTIYHF